MRVRWGCAGCVVLAAVSLGTVAVADAPPPLHASGPPAAPVAPSRVDLTTFAAHEITRLAMLDLRALGEPASADYGIACLLLARAEKLTPHDAELVRRRVESAWNWGDQPTLLATSTRLITLDPSDTVAQLRLISAKLSQLQRVEERVAAYDRLSGEEGARAKLDPAIRSRLALDAALLVRERGDEKKFIEKLKLAVTLDPTNKDAALLACNYFEERRSDRAGTLEMLSNLLYADPFDPAIHRRLVDEFARGGAFEAATRFHANFADLATLAGGQMRSREMTERLALMWLRDGADKALEDLNITLESTRMQVAKEREMREAAGLDLRDTPEVKDVRLAIDMEPIRLLAAVALRDEATAKLSIADLAATVAKNNEILNDPLRRPASFDDQTAKETARSQIFDLQLWRCLTNIDVDKVAPDMPAASAGLDENNPYLLALRSMAATRTGDLLAGAALLDDADPGVDWIAMARALNAQAAGDKPLALLAFQAVASANPLTPHGAHAVAAARSLRAELGKEPEYNAYVKRLEHIGAGIPMRLDEMIRSPRTFEAMDVAFTQTPASPLVPARARVTLRNTSTMPLGLGAGRAINSRFLFGPLLDAGATNLLEIAQPEVLDLERKLRLVPREGVEGELAPDLGPTGWLIQTLSSRVTRVRWRVIQGFQTRSDGARVPGTGCLEDTTDAIVRGTLPESSMPFRELASAIAVASEDAIPALAVATRAQLVLGDEFDAEVRLSLGSAWAARYPALPPRLRQCVLCVLPPATVLSELKPLDEAVVHEQDPDVLAVAVVARANDPLSPLLATALASADPQLTKLAELHKIRLTSGAKPYAIVGPGMIDELRKLLSPNAAPPETSSTGTSSTGSSSLGTGVPGRDK